MGNIESLSVCVLFIVMATAVVCGLVGISWWSCDEKVEEEKGLVLRQRVAPRPPPPPPTLEERTEYVERLLGHCVRRLGLLDASRARIDDEERRLLLSLGSWERRRLRLVGEARQNEKKN